MKGKGKLEMRGNFSPNGVFNLWSMLHDEVVSMQPVKPF